MHLDVAGQSCLRSPILTVAGFGPGYEEPVRGLVSRRVAI
jgi:hypothetical protein